MVGSKLLEGKQEFLKKLCLILKQGMLSKFLVTYTYMSFCQVLISLKRYWGLLFLQIFKNIPSFLYQRSN